MLSIAKSPDLQVGAGMHDWRLKDDLGSQPPRQYAPVPQFPYDEQQGESAGHFELGLQVCIVLWAETTEAAAKASAAARRRTIVKMLCNDQVLCGWIPS